MNRFIAFLFLGFFCAVPVFGEYPAKPRPFPFHSVVVSVDEKAQTFRMGKKVIHQVYVSKETKILKSDETPATFAAIMPGVEVRGSVRKRADGDYDAVSLKIDRKSVV